MVIICYGNMAIWYVFFFRSPQGLPRPLFGVLRLIYASFAIADLVWIGLEHPSGSWTIHLGNWSRVVTALYFLLGFLTTIHRSVCRSKESDQYKRIYQDGRYSSQSNSCALKPGQKDKNLVTSVNHLSWHHEVLWVLHTLAADSSFVCTSSSLTSHCSSKSATHLWGYLTSQDTLFIFFWRLYSQWPVISPWSWCTSCTPTYSVPRT